MIHGSMVHDITLVWLTEGAGDPFSMSQRKLFRATAARSSYNNNMQKCVHEFMRISERIDIVFHKV